LSGFASESGRNIESRFRCHPCGHVGARPQNHRVRLPFAPVLLLSSSLESKIAITYFAQARPWKYWRCNAMATKHSQRVSTAVVNGPVLIAAWFGSIIIQKSELQHLVLVGDPRQLPASVKDKQAK